MTRASPSPETESPNPLHALMPSTHVWSKFGSPGCPHFVNQAPPRAQQLGMPDFLEIPHLGHGRLVVTVITGVRPGDDKVCILFQEELADQPTREIDGERGSKRERERERERKRICAPIKDSTSQLFS